MTQDEIKKILNVGVLLSSERNLDRLLEKILISVMEISGCDAGTLYLLNQDRLYFTIMRNDTMKVYQGGDGERPDIPPVLLKRENVCALALMEGRTINISLFRRYLEYYLSHHPEVRVKDKDNSAIVMMVRQLQLVSAQRKALPVLQEAAQLYLEKNAPVKSTPAARKKKLLHPEEEAPEE